MKKYIFVVLLFFVNLIFLTAQISHGGQPLPFNTARSIQPADFFVEMPSFDVASELRTSEAESSQLKSLYFAHKFFVHLRPDNSGMRFTTTDGTNVWRVGIRSKDAYSLNILFTKYRIPEGAKAFVYNADQTEILGSYTHENNTELNLLPIQPITGSELIVEYQEPANAAFEGEIEIGEVNHDFVGILRASEPRDPSQSCHPNILCYDDDAEPGASVVLLIINGNMFCSGALVNNSDNDGAPYLLTATHCLNENYKASFLLNRKYDMMAGTIVAFFNYQSPVCDRNIRGTTQMTLASADSVLIDEKYDISLIRFKDMPPKEYQPYYLGWNVSSSPLAPFHGLHHPNGGIKKVAVTDGALYVTTFNEFNMQTNGHWGLAGWDVGNTEGGSSGSPLVDKNKRLVGMLTGGISMCSSPRGPDYYSSLNKAWTITGSLGNPNSLQTYLDPQNSLFTQIDGLNPYKDEPLVRSENFGGTETVTQSTYNSVSMFATNNAFGYTEFAESFVAKNNSELQGVFVASPPCNNISGMNIKVKVYSDNNGAPGTLLREKDYIYSYAGYTGGVFGDYQRNMNNDVENYIDFGTPITVSGKYYISYSETNGVSGGFAAFNTEPRSAGSGISSTAWMKNSSGWVRSSENIENPINTALLVSAYLIGDSSQIVIPDEETFKLNIYHLPEANRIFIESNLDLLSWDIFYISGQKIYSGNTDLSINRASFSSSMLPKGVYIVRVKTVNGKEEARKVFVR